VIYDPALNDAVTKICKPDGKVIGSLFGWHTKEIFALAKSGLFIENTDGSVLVGEWILPAWSYELSYITNDSTENVEVHEGITMSIEWTITPDLAREWYARDLIRSIQDARKDADYDIADRIYISLTWDIAQEIITHHGIYIAEETLSTLVDNIETPDISKDVILWASSVCVELFRG
jgi:isoleucyl-tRNA synthetase